MSQVGAQVVSTIDKGIIKFETELNNPCFLEDAVRAVFGDGLPGTGGEGEGKSFLEFGHINTFLLEIGVLANRPCGVELGSTGSVGVTSTHLGTLL